MPETPQNEPTPAEREGSERPEAREVRPTRVPTAEESLRERVPSLRTIEIRERELEDRKAELERIKGTNPDLEESLQHEIVTAIQERARARQEIAVTLESLEGGVGREEAINSRFIAARYWREFAEDRSARAREMEGSSVERERDFESAASYYHDTASQILHAVRLHEAEGPVGREIAKTLIPLAVADLIKEIQNYSEAARCLRERGGEDYRPRGSTLAEIITSKQTAIQDLQNRYR